MSELKAFKIKEAEDSSPFWQAEYEVYSKSEADKVIEELKESVKNLILDNYLKDKELRHHKYKRCLAMANFCEIQHDYYGSDFWWRWYRRWLNLANKFKEAK